MGTDKNIKLHIVTDIKGRFIGRWHVADQDLALEAEALLLEEIKNERSVKERRNVRNVVDAQAGHRLHGSDGGIPKVIHVRDHHHHQGHQVLIDLVVRSGGIARWLRRRMIHELNLA